MSRPPTALPSDPTILGIRRRRRAALAAGLALAAAAPPAAAQMPGVPLLQNGFVRPGAAVAANYGTADATDVVGVAGAWTPGSGRFQISAGVGSLGVDGVDGRKTTGGLRGALPIRTPWTRDPASAVGITGFVGVGGASLDEGTLVQVPLGLGIGYRRRLGEARAVAVFATPFYQWTRVSGVEAVEGAEEAELDSNLFRVSLGAEALLTRRIGVTLGYELGTTAEDGRPGPTGGIFGAGVAFVF
jgi:hypothetical protein